MICDSGLEQPEIRPAPLSDLHHPVQKGDMAAALPPAPFILSPVMLAGFLRGHHETTLGKDGFAISSCAFFGYKKLFLLYACASISSLCLSTLPHANPPAPPPLGPPLSTAHLVVQLLLSKATVN